MAPRLFPISVFGLLGTMSLLNLAVASEGGGVSGATDLSSSALLRVADEAEAELRENILSFWLKHGRDAGGTGFAGELDEGLRDKAGAPRGSLLTARILWTYSAAFAHRPDPAYLKMAGEAYASLEKHFLDRDRGGYYWRVARDGRVVDDRKQIYGQSFVLYALAEYHACTKDPEALKRAVALYHLIETRSRDRGHGGYLEAFTRDWKRPSGMQLSDIGPEEPKSQNTHLHLMESYTALLRVWPDEGLKADLRALVELMLTRIPGKDGRHLQLYFREDWTPRSDRYSYGHDIEANWLLCEASRVLGDAELNKRVKQAALSLADSCLAEGVDAEGAVYNEGGPEGLSDRGREWWQQAEAIVGFANAYQLSKDKRHLAAALRCWDLIRRRFVDAQGGEWHKAIGADGAPLAGQPKLSFWKCPYHNARACLEFSARLRAIAAESGSGK